MNLEFMRCINGRDRTICCLKIQTNVSFYASVLLLTMNIVLTLSKSSTYALSYRLAEQHLLRQS